MVKQFSQDLNLTTILKTIRINRSTYYYWLKIEEKLKLKQTKYFLQQKRIKVLCYNKEEVKQEIKIIISTNYF
ncbi:Putative transposase tra5 for insertion sequence element IS150 [Strawberry lethal yellows phytoplasma (CPA) str. NZSb11]|uniref:Putative transposase tra5 for insertion sequence element IS150 n=1 Tax=Strawberry lethal yellows phytoplasma (CPA) str. NZSb11 TaxID=980422 RepID=R4RPX1_PHYAS|nr:Putative transposase tra5 for insertion sequence element IS150 [Strawberry lethal yellows phytoplasma (CPA) str. NZSb11]